MNAIARRLLVAAVRKLLPDAVPPDPRSALALRSTAALAPVSESRSTEDFLPTVGPSQILHAPPPRRRKVVTETVIYEEREW